MGRFEGVADRDAVENEMPWEAREVPRTIYEFLGRVKDRHGTRPAISFQLLSGPSDKAETLTWAELYGRVTQAANLFRSLGVGPDDVVAYMLPNANETAITLLGGMVAGIVNPINPLLEAEQIAAILRETGAKVLVTLKSFPRTDVAQKAAEAVIRVAVSGMYLEVSKLVSRNGIDPRDLSLIAFGGERSGHFFGDVHRYVPATDTWSFVAARNSSAAVARAEHVAAMHGDVLVVFGGRGAAGPLGDVWTVDLGGGDAATSNAWIRLAAPAELTPRFGHAAAVHAGAMYVVGGFVASRNPESEGALSSEAWRFDMRAREWTFLGPRTVAAGEDDVGDAAAAVYATLQFPAPLPDPRRRLRGPEDVSPAAWLWERVPGARLEVRAEPGSRLRVEIEVELPRARRRFRWWGEAGAGPDGLAILRVPYATDAATEELRVVRARWSLDGEERPLLVPESAVRGGGRVPLAP
jgi:hypothetical protein